MPLGGAESLLERQCSPALLLLPLLLLPLKLQVPREVKGAKERVREREIKLRTNPRKKMGDKPAFPEATQKEIDDIPAEAHTLWAMRNGKGQTPCIEYAKGKCAKGTECVFAHDLNLNKDQRKMLVTYETALRSKSRAARKLKQKGKGKGKRAAAAALAAAAQEE